jgi:hypothetical protein
VVLRKISTNFIQDNISTHTHLIAQLLQGRPGTDCRVRARFSVLHSVETGSRIPEALASRVNRLGRETFLNLVPRSRIMELYLHSPVNFGDMMLN